VTFSVLEPRSLDLGDISKPWSNLCLCSEEIQNLPQNVLPWVVLWLTISKFTMYCSWKYPYSPMKGFFFGLNRPPLRTFWFSIILYFKNCVIGNPPSPLEFWLTFLGVGLVFLLGLHYWLISSHVYCLDILRWNVTDLIGLWYHGHLAEFGCSECYLIVRFLFHFGGILGSFCFTMGFLFDYFLLKQNHG